MSVRDETKAPESGGAFVATGCGGSFKARIVDSANVNPERDRLAAAIRIDRDICAHG